MIWFNLILFLWEPLCKLMRFISLCCLVFCFVSLLKYWFWGYHSISSLFQDFSVCTHWVFLISWNAFWVSRLILALTSLWSVNVDIDHHMILNLKELLVYKLCDDAVNWVLVRTSMYCSIPAMRPSTNTFCHA